MNSSLQHVYHRLCKDVQESLKSKKENEIEWTTNPEVLFFLAMIGFKPVGVNRHFMMCLIHNKFSNAINHQISSKVLWDHLESLYDMAALNESEIIPFPNDQTDYDIPEDCYDLIKSKYGVQLKSSSNEGDSAKNNDKSSENLKAAKKLGTPKIKPGTTPVPTKTVFATPIPSKSLKSQNTVKNEVKSTTSEGTPKIKSDSGSSVKVSKSRRSSSPFTNKTPKLESTPISKQDIASDLSSIKKVKLERGSSPLTTRKPVKNEPSSTSNSSKKSTKGEPSTPVSRSSKEPTPEGSVKKVKTEKDVPSKKNKTSDNSSSSKKSVKPESVNGMKKRSESDSTSRKSSDASVMKSAKSETKSSTHSSRGQDAETTSISGSRKSSPVTKVRSTDGSKKVKHVKQEEPSKRIAIGPKRRRIT